MLDIQATVWIMAGMAKKRPTKFREQLRQAILNSEYSRYAIAKATGVSQPVLSKFVHGKVGLSLDAIDILMAFLDLEIVPRRS